MQLATTALSAQSWCMRQGFYKSPKMIFPNFSCQRGRKSWEIGKFPNFSATNLTILQTKKLHTIICYPVSEQWTLVQNGVLYGVSSHHLSTSDGSECCCPFGCWRWADTNTSHQLFATCFIGSQCHSKYSLK